MNVTAGARNVSTVPTQALTLLNNAFVLRQAQLFADRVRKEAGDDLDEADRSRLPDRADAPADRGRSARWRWTLDQRRSSLESSRTCCST